MREERLLAYRIVSSLRSWHQIAKTKYIWLLGYLQSAQKGAEQHNHFHTCKYSGWRIKAQVFDRGCDCHSLALVSRLPNRLFSFLIAYHQNKSEQGYFETLSPSLCLNLNSSAACWGHWWGRPRSSYNKYDEWCACKAWKAASAEEGI